MIVFYRIQGPLSSNLFSQYIWALTLCSVEKYCDGNREPRKIKFFLLLLVIYPPITSKPTERNMNVQGIQRFGKTQWLSYLNIYLSKTVCMYRTDKHLNIRNSTQILRLLLLVLSVSLMFLTVLQLQARFIGKFFLHNSPCLLPPF